MFVQMGKNFFSFPTIINDDDDDEIVPEAKFFLNEREKKTRVYSLKPRNELPPFFCRIICLGEKRKLY